MQNGSAFRFAKFKSVCMWETRVNLTDLCLSTCLDLIWHRIGCRKMQKAVKLLEKTINISTDKMALIRLYIYLRRNASVTTGAVHKLSCMNVAQFINNIAECACTRKLFARWVCARKSSFGRFIPVSKPNEILD